jgi:hypothetical protein
MRFGRFTRKVLEDSNLFPAKRLKAHGERILLGVTPLKLFIGSPALAQALRHSLATQPFLPQEDSRMKSAKLLSAVLFLACCASGQTLPNAIKIGTLQYGGVASDGTSQYVVTLNTTGVTAAALTFGNVRLHVNGLFEDTAPQGPIKTPAGILYVGGPPPWNLPACNPDYCVAIVVQLFTTDGKPMTFTLADGQQFTTWGVNTTTMVSKLGQAELIPGQKTPIYLRRDAKGL